MGTVCPMSPYMGTVCPMSPYMGTVCPMSPYMGTVCPMSPYMGTVCPMSPYMGTVCPMSPYMGTVCPMSPYMGTVCPMSPYMGTVCPMSLEQERAQGNGSCALLPHPLSLPHSHACSSSLLALSHRTKPYLLFFDLTRCATKYSISDLVKGNVDTSKLFTCPTPQVGLLPPPHPTHIPFPLPCSSLQVCVEACPTMNELGLRENPVCVDGVDTTPFQNIDLLNFTAYLVCCGGWEGGEIEGGIN